MDFNSLLKNYKTQIDNALRDYLNKEKEKFSTPIFDYIIDFCLRGGKRLRPILFIVSYESMGNKNNEEIVKASLSIELLEAFLLIHDDIIDQDDIRRGGPSLHKMLPEDEHFGLSFAIMAGDLLNSFSIKAIMETNFPQKLKLRAIKELINAQIDCFYGELYDVMLERKPNATEEDIFNIIDLKTVSYTTKAPLVMGAILGGASNSHIDKLYNYAKLLGRAFQIVDDILGTFGDEKITGKPIDSDIKQGKKTLLVVYAFSHNKGEELNKYLGNKNLTKEDLACVRNIFIETGALSYLKNKAYEYIKEANSIVNSMDITPDSKSFLYNLNNFIIERNF